MLSVSKDTLIKLWDLTTQHCIETLIGHRSEIWGLDVNKDENLIVTGALDQELKFWDIDTETLVTGIDNLEIDSNTETVSHIFFFILIVCFCFCLIYKYIKKYIYCNIINNYS